MRPWFRRYRYVAVIVGEESGNITELPFVRFRTLNDGRAWIVAMNIEHPGLPTRYDLRPIPRDGAR